MMMIFLMFRVMPYSTALLNPWLYLPKVVVTLSSEYRLSRIWNAYADFCDFKNLGSPSRIGVAPASLNDGNFDCNSVSFTGVVFSQIPCNLKFWCTSCQFSNSLCWTLVFADSELFFSVVNESADQSGQSFFFLWLSEYSCLIKFLMLNFPVLAVAPDFPKPFPSFSTVCGNTSGITDTMKFPIFSATLDHELFSCQ